MRIIKCTILFLLISASSYPSEYDKIWGITLNDFSKNFSSSSGYMKFNPEERPDYNNKIISFLESMAGCNFDLKILRKEGTPEIDYCFFNNKLYSVSENWGEISANTSDNILNQYQKEYNKPEIDEKESTIVYTFTKEKNRALIFKKTIDQQKVNLKILHYTNEIFKMMLSD